MTGCKQRAVPHRVSVDLEPAVARKLLPSFSVLSAGTLLSYLWKIDPYSLFRDPHQILILPICSM